MCLLNVVEILSVQIGEGVVDTSTKLGDHEVMRGVVIEINGVDDFVDESVVGLKLD